MKKKFVLIAAGLCLMLGITSNSVAQIKLGAIGGVNFNDLSGDDVDSEDMSIGYHLGGFINIGNTLMIEPQVLYSRKGSDHLDLDYLEIPIWVRYQFDGGLNFQAGPFMAVLLGDNSSGDEITDYKSTDWGMGVGLGYQLEGGLGIAVNWNQGLSSIGEDYKYLGQSLSFDAKTTCIKLSVSYMFGGRRE